MQNNHALNKEETEQMIESPVNKNSTKAQLLLIEASKLKSSQKSRFIEKLLLGIGAFMLMNTYSYVESDVLDMGDIVFFLVIFIFMIVGRYWQKFDQTEQQLALLSKAILALSQSRDTTTDQKK